ncbi:MAG TPA: hypothetical protein VFD58_22985 [Blastocatellia bacterium]|nr:hypothetical protein [Blastocatellia bacterium]
MSKNVFRSKPWDEKQIARWEGIRAKGKWRFVLISGVLFFGTIFTVAINIFDYFFSNIAFNFWFNVVTPYAIGFMNGLFGWKGNEKKYSQSP